MDISGSNVYIENISIINPGDKGISGGERSNITASNINIDGGYICVASKDLSKLKIDGSKLQNCEYGLAVYQKKSEYGPASIDSTNTNIFSVENEYIVEKDSSLSLNGKIIIDGKSNVYEKLYPLEK